MHTNNQQHIQWLLLIIRFINKAIRSEEVNQGSSQVRGQTGRCSLLSGLSGRQLIARRSSGSSSLLSGLSGRQLIARRSIRQQFIAKWSIRQIVDSKEVNQVDSSQLGSIRKFIVKWSIRLKVNSQQLNRVVIYSQGVNQVNVSDLLDP